MHLNSTDIFKVKLEDSPRDVLRKELTGKFFQDVCFLCMAKACVYHAISTCGLGRDFMIFGSGF